MSLVADPYGNIGAANSRAVPSPKRTIKVRAHTRTIKARPAPTLAQTVGGAATELTSAAKTVAMQPTAAIAKAITRSDRTPAVNTQSVRPALAPARVSTVQRFAPHYRSEPVAGYVTRPGSAGVPYYTDAYTKQHHAGPTGQESTQWNAAQVAQAHRIQVANYGRPGTILRSLLPGGADEGGINAGNAVSRAASAASFLPGGGVGEAAGILGFGLKGLKGLRAAKGVAEAAPAVERAVVAPPRLIPTKRDPVTGYTSPDLPIDEFFGLMPKGDHLYHATTPENLGRIRTEGLTPGKERKGEPTGVYLAEDGLSVHGLLPGRARTNDVILRVHRADVQTKISDMYKPGSGFEEHYSTGCPRT